MKKDKVEVEIIDKRTVKDFTGISFSKYKKTQVIKQLIKCVNDNKLEDAIYWSAELICSGHYLDLWDTIFLIMSKNIYLNNPKLPIYLLLKVNKFKEEITCHLNNELILRNNKSIRKLFAEIISILVYSKKKQSYDYVKVDNSNYNLNEMSHRLKADSLEYCKNVFKLKDPKEIFIPINELCYHLFKTKNQLDIFYWIEWLHGYELLCKKKKEKIVCHKRENLYYKEPTELIWLLWSCIYKCIPNKNKFLEKIINSLFDIYKLHYSPGIKKKRKHILYYCVYLITENIDINIPITKNIELINNISNNTDKIYKIIKKNEIQPDTVKSYLFAGLEM